MSRRSTVEFDGKTFTIAQPGGRCCESGCDDCELYPYKKANGFPMYSSRTGYFQELKENPPEPQPLEDPERKK